MVDRKISIHIFRCSLFFFYYFVAFARSTEDSHTLGKFNDARLCVRPCTEQYVRPSHHIFYTSPLANLITKSTLVTSIQKFNRNLFHFFSLFPILQWLNAMHTRTWQKKNWTATAAIESRTDTNDIVDVLTRARECVCLALTSLFEQCNFEMVIYFFFSLFYSYYIINIIETVQTDERG